jgi:hypothetical protein
MGFPGTHTIDYYLSMIQIITFALGISVVLNAGSLTDEKLIFFRMRPVVHKAAVKSIC